MAETLFSQDRYNSSLSPSSANLAIDYQFLAELRFDWHRFLLLPRKHQDHIVNDSALINEELESTKLEFHCHNILINKQLVVQA
jgi:hypothetical protein